MSVHGIKTDWNQYVGKWYEQARIPSWFEPSSMSDSTAEYIPLQDGSIQVVNRGIDFFGTPIRAEGRATVDPSSQGTLNVSFFAPFSAKYVVLSHGTSYDMAVVGSPSREYLWLLTRNPTATADQWSQFASAARRNGYTAAQLNKVQKTPTRNRLGGGVGIQKTPARNRLGGGVGGGRRASSFVPTAWSGNIERLTARNRRFRRVLKTGRNLQLVLMKIKPQKSIGLEVHPHVDQFFRVERGQGRLDVGPSKQMLASRRIHSGTAMFVPAGTWHNVTNTSRSNPLSLYTLYAPPNHPHE